MEPGYEILHGEAGLAEATALRHRVFVGEQGVPREIETDADDLTADHILVREGDRVIGTGRLVTMADADGAAYGKIGRMAVDPAWRGRGIGRAMLDRLVDLARRKGHPRVVLNAQCGARRFYEAAGFAATSPVFQEAGIDHVRMERALP